MKIVKFHEGMEFIREKRKPGLSEDAKASGKRVCEFISQLVTVYIKEIVKQLIFLQFETDF
jgi:hypothetical protein